MKKFAMALVCAAAFTGSISAQAANVLMAETSLYKGQSLISKNGLYWLMMQNDGNLVLYIGFIQPQAYRGFNSETVNGGAFAHMQMDGNFNVYKADGTWGWSAGTGGRPYDMNYKLTLGEDGTLAIRDPSGNAIKTLHYDYCPSGGGQTYPYPTHVGQGGDCRDMAVIQSQCGVDAQNKASAAGTRLGRCQDNIGPGNY